MIDAHRKAFIEEATELLSELESTLLEVEERPDDKELIAKIFRALHTIKGSSGMFGYDDITMFTHDIENVYDKIRNGEIAITKVIIDLTLAARDQISLMLIHADDKSKLDESATKDILVSFRSIINDYNSKTSKTAEIESKPEKNKIEAVKAEEKIYLVQFAPSLDIFLNGTNPICLLNELCDLGPSIVKGNLHNVPSIDQINPEKCYINWSVLLKTSKGIDSIKDVFIFVEDECEIKTKEVDSQTLLKEEEFIRFEEYLRSKAAAGISELETHIKNFENELIQKDVSRTQKSELKKSVDSHHEADSASSIRVSADKLDELVNLVGELVTIQARLSQIATTNNDANIISVSEEVERITWSLRDSALNIRMLPIGTTFSKFKRLVRDLSKELGKEVELTTDGAETELDKTVIEKLNDPLIHIIRNSIDHGIELPEERVKAGKARTGVVHLSATQSGGSVLIKISDDGYGMNKDAIREKAVRMGIINENAELTDSEIYSLVFAAGFSTAQKVTNVSGRGVGMDVVKRAIEALRGTVEVTSKKGIGTTITLKLPLTLAIIDGLLVKIANEHFILPLSSVEECIELSQKDIERAHGRHIVNIRGEIVPYINLRERFDIDGNKPEIEQIVVAGIKGMRVGFVVDLVIGQHQTVLKTLGKIYKNVEGVSGATILGDGTVALILDIVKLLENEELTEKAIN